MSYTSQDASNGGGGLEDRMRDLILKNAQTPGIEVPQLSSATTSALPPHLLAASDVDQQDYLKRRSDLAKITQPTGSPKSQSPGGRKRLNQAQRRQMNAQLSIPVDTRPSTEALGSGRGFSTPSRFPPTSAGLQRGYGPPGHNNQQNRLDSNDFHNRNVSYASPHRQEPHYQQNQPHYSNHQWQRDHHWGQGQRSTAHMNQASQFTAQSHTQSPDQYDSRPNPQNRQLYNPGPSGNSRGLPISINPEQLAAQSGFVQVLINEVVSVIGIDPGELAEKEEFRIIIEQACRDSIVSYERHELGNDKFEPSSVQLKCFGSMASGFATKGSDMDLALLSPLSNPTPDSSESALPRLLEKKLLSMGYGARLLTRTRVPIIKLCQKPTEKLRHDLLEERLRWENGFTGENDNDDGDVVQSLEGGNANDLETCNIVEHLTDNNDLTSKTPREVYEERLACFQQKPKLSMGDYYGAAKRLLRDGGGRDVGTAYMSLPTVQEIKVLTEVSKVFVNGLANEELKKRLQSYASLAFEQNEDPQHVRALSSIFTQMEGEQLAMAWKHRQLVEKTVELQCGQVIKDWQVLMNQTIHNTMSYNRMLSQTLERLRKFSSLQMLFLEQYEHEDAIQYSARVTTMVSDLFKLPTSAQSMSSIVNTHYVNGIRSGLFREKLKVLLAENEDVSFETTILQHRTLELAQDYEKGLSRGMFEEDDQQHIKEYIALLKEKCSAVGPWKLTDSMITLLTKIQSLPDPTTIYKPRDRYSDHLEYPKSGIGVQCDINFSADLALHNTLLLRCYSHTDRRVMPLIIFIKHWAKRRGINTAYRGTLSSYGYVLMVLHYLTNVANPFVCPNLQHLAQPPSSDLPSAELTAQTTCQGCDVRFWRNEEEIADLAQRGMLNHNQDSIGCLARGFFEYFAHSGTLSTGNGRGFDWGREVLSLRTQGGLVTKQYKGWVSARTVTETTTESAPATLIPATPSSAATSTSIDKMSPLNPLVESNTPRKLVTKAETKEIRHRYLFAIEDPFETDHNVARTVTHNGVVSIRDEFRRAWRIIKSAGKTHEGGLLDEVLARVDGKRAGAREAMKAIFGWEKSEAG